MDSIMIPNSLTREYASGEINIWLTSKTKFTDRAGILAQKDISKFPVLLNYTAL